MLPIYVFLLCAFYKDFWKSSISSRRTKRKHRDNEQRDQVLSHRADISSYKYISHDFYPNVSATINSTLYVSQLSKNLRQISLARLSLRTEKARFFPGPSFPFPDNSPKPNATALADARGTCISECIALVKLQYHSRIQQHLMPCTNLIPKMNFDSCNCSIWKHLRWFNYFAHLSDFSLCKSRTFPKYSLTTFILDVRMVALVLN